MKIEKTEQKTSRGTVAWYTITNDKGASVTLSALGAGIVAIKVPDKTGKLDDVVIGYPEAESYIADGPCAGKVPGRYANRIAEGKIKVNGKEYTLPINNGPNHLHGGPEGFQNQVWESREVGSDSVAFTYHAKDGEAGYPGALTAKVTYKWSDDNVLDITLEATTDASTIVNLTNHAYFNLGGHGSGSGLGQLLQLNASRWLPTDPTEIPTGEIASVAGTPMDFTLAKELGKDIEADFEALHIGKGYDHCWLIDGYEQGVEMRAVGTLRDVKSGRRLDVVSDQPGVQVYTGNWLEGCPKGKDGAVYHDYAAVALECQGAPDAPHHTDFPSQQLNPGEKYLRHIRFAFSAE